MTRFLAVLILRSLDATLLKKAQEYSTTQSSSIGALRWNLPEEDIQVHNSAPSRPITSGKLTGHSQQQPRQNSLKDLRSLQECVQFIQHWKEQVDQVCKHAGADPEAAPPKSEKSVSRTERSLEESRKLISEWADELRHVDKFLEGNPWKQDREDTQEHKKDLDTNEDAQMRVMEWAKEVQTVSESCGVQSEELGKVLRLLGIKKKRLGVMLPLLEFITWSLLKEDSAGMMPQLWLSAKQRTWKPGSSKYIPNSVWDWIRCAEADVLLDPKTNHPWLTLSEDQRQVQEGLRQVELPHTSQRFDSWQCVLAWEGYNRGRHYWEVDIANSGYWRVGLTTVNSQRHGRFPMNPKTGYWCLWRSTHQFYACTKPETPLPAGLVPRRMGIFLDYEEGQVSFYNAESKTHIYTFTGAFKGKVYPLFTPLDGRTLMTIMPPRSI
nr:E3 ubiquitin-protein ligase TRIM21-like [Nerophis lumbriciformis]